MLDAALNLLQFELERRRARLGRCHAPVPQIAEHRMGHLEHFAAGLQLRQQGFKLRLDHIAPDRLALFRAIVLLVLTQVLMAE
ncbi:hypothetical protein [Sphingobium sp. MK2]|uniref:hypothetical protein n=1 Tax=Sphingobium sp. MK2 TaxID=3116540 RepID=UPI0032E35F70